MKRKRIWIWTIGYKSRTIYEDQYGNWHFLGWRKGK